MSPDPSDRAAPVVTFLSDYGYADEFVGVCHCVIARRCPTARIIDLGHGFPHHDIRAGALALRAALPYAPAGVHLAVVDPGVGSDRRALALRTREETRILVGPDNGLLLPAAALFGGVSEAVDISDSPEALRPISATFHGRDVFAAVAAALADGAPTEAVGRAIEPGSLIELELPTPTREGDSLHAHVLSIDGFGNVALDVEPSTLAGAARLLLEAADGESAAPLGRTFADVAPGELVAYADSRGRLALAVNRGSAAAFLRVAVDDEIVLRAR
ncbi:MAG: SAM-dependent chlorinase/fluorinase [Solirubrobacteraceae bacterium]